MKTQFFYGQHFPASFYFIFTSFGSISFNMGDILSINPSTDVFTFGDFNVHRKSCIIYSFESDKTSQLCYNFSFSNDLT